MRVPLLPLRDIIVFPHMVVPLFVGRQKSIRALEEAMNKQKFILLAAQKDAKTNDPAEEDIYQVGTLGTRRAAAPASRRHRQGAGRGQEARARRAVRRSRRVLPGRGRGDRGGLRQDDRGRGADPQRQLDLRELRQAQQEDPARDDHVGGVDRRSGAARRHDRRAPRHQARRQADAARDRSIPAERLEKVLGYMRSEIEILEVEKRIRTRVKKQMEKTQKEYYLNEQMRAIQKELGEKDEFKNEIQELEEKIKAEEDVGRGAREGREGAQEAQDDVADVRRGDGRPQLHRLDHLAAVERVHRGQARHRRGREGPRRGPLRSREGEAAHPRVPGGAEPGRAAARARSCVWSVLRASARRRSASRSRAPRAASSCACRSAACATRPRSAAIAAPTSARCPARSSSR